MESKLRSEVSLESQVEPKRRLDANLKGQMESKLGLENGWTALQGLRTAAPRLQVALGGRLDMPSGAQNGGWSGWRGATWQLYLQSGRLQPLQDLHFLELRGLLAEFNSR